MLPDNLFNWLMKSLTRSKSDLANYVYNRKTNTLFAYSIIDGTLTPWYRNSFFKIKEVEIRFEDELNKVKRNDSNIVSLPYISFMEKKEFLNSFASGVDSNLKNRLIEDLQRLDEDSPLTFYTSLKEISTSLALLFEKAKWKFISQKIKELYEPLGINETSSILY